MAKLIQYDNFRATVEEVATPGGPRRVLQILDLDSADIHAFAWPVADAQKVGAALQGTAVQTAPASALSDLSKIVKPPGAP